ncbi:hypothetical protein Bca52824_002193 [Brassica carinata]|uniref:Helicase ATP-binding domain-containing protein n=1 Tax=Brassica carinata TaxID=52824 RepID=A0A8X8BE32_BRACI|nr:hypothetical protein Bca52824_002193 [Brassica carinata]
MNFDLTASKENEFEDYFSEKGASYGESMRRSIPIALTGRDILARAKNGTGKTAAFCIPVLEKIDQDNNAIQAVITVPTRELALQTSQVCKELGKHLVTTGGTSLKDDIMCLYQPVHLLVGTPGKFLDLTKKGVCVLKDCSVLAIDEVPTYDRWSSDYDTWLLFRKVSDSQAAQTLSQAHSLDGKRFNGLSKSLELRSSRFRHISIRPFIANKVDFC